MTIHNFFWCENGTFCARQIKLRCVFWMSCFLHLPACKLFDARMTPTYMSVLPFIQHSIDYHENICGAGQSLSTKSVVKVVIFDMT